EDAICAGRERFDLPISGERRAKTQRGAYDSDADAALVVLHHAGQAAVARSARRVPAAGDRRGRAHAAGAGVVAPQEGSPPVRDSEDARRCEGATVGGEDALREEEEAAAAADAVALGRALLA